MNKQLLADLKTAEQEIELLFPATGSLAEKLKVNNTQIIIIEPAAKARKIVDMNGSEITIYPAENGKYDVELRLKDTTLWITKEQMAILFDSTPEEILKQIKNVLTDGELERDETVKSIRYTDENGKRREQPHYNLDMAISVGFRVNSKIAVHFRKWATNIIGEYLVNGYVINPRRASYDTGYFQDLLRKIREIRAGEQEMYAQFRELVKTTSADYDDHPSEDIQRAFSILQNKLHVAITGQTGPEIVASRIDGSKRNMGMTSWKGNKITESEARTAKNYLAQTELEHYERLVSLLYDFAMFQAAVNKQTMTIDAWLKKLDGFLVLNDRKVVDGGGSISREKMEKLVRKEYKKYQDRVKYDGELPDQG